MHFAALLKELSEGLAGASLHPPAVAAAQAAVDVLHGFQPSPQQQAAFLALLEAAEQLLASLRQD